MNVSCELMVVYLIRKLHSSDLNVSPVGRQPRVTAILSSGLTLSRIKVSFFKLHNPHFPRGIEISAHLLESTLGMQLRLQVQVL